VLIVNGWAQTLGPLSLDLLTEEREEQNPARDFRSLVITTHSGLFGSVEAAIIYRNAERRDRPSRSRQRGIAVIG
jgi:hypothetical protein